MNNAGGWRHNGLREIKIPEFEWVYRVNVMTAFVATRAIMDIMIAQNSGRIVNVTSGAAHRPHLGMPHYSAAKAALVNFTRSFAMELAPSNILVNAVSPGPMATEEVKRLGIVAERAKSVPLGRIAEPEDIAEIVLFLSSQKNKFLVGQTILANGGAF